VKNLLKRWEFKRKLGSWKGVGGLCVAVLVGGLFLGLSYFC
jgi:hypothetical protein